MSGEKVPTGASGCCSFWQRCAANRRINGITDVSKRDSRRNNYNSEYKLLYSMRAGNCQFVMWLGEREHEEEKEEEKELS